MHEGPAVRAGELVRVHTLLDECLLFVQQLPATSFQHALHLQDFPDALTLTRFIRHHLHTHSQSHMCTKPTPDTLVSCPSIGHQHCNGLHSARCTPRSLVHAASSITPFITQRRPLQPHTHYSTTPSKQYNNGF